MYMHMGGGGVDLMYVISVPLASPKSLANIKMKNSPFTCKYFTSN